MHVPLLLTRRNGTLGIQLVQLFQVPELLQEFLIWRCLLGCSTLDRLVRQLVLIGSLCVIVTVLHWAAQNQLPALRGSQEVNPYRALLAGSDELLDLLEL